MSAVIAVWSRLRQRSLDHKDLDDEEEAGLREKELR